MNDKARLHYDDLADRLSSYRTMMSENPQINPIQRLGHHLSRQLECGDITTDDLQELTRELTLRAFLRRADDLGQYVGETDRDRNTESLDLLFDRLFSRADSFRDAASLVQREVYGIVFTAHPTFSTNKNLRSHLAGIAIDPKKREDPALQDSIRVQHHGPAPKITLALEAEEVQDAIAQCQKALAVIYTSLFRAARKHWPDEWEDMSPRLITIASWVGYDLDGRTDISWTTSFVWRLKEKKLQFERLARRLEHLVQQHTPPVTLQERLNGLIDLLGNHARSLTRQIAHFSDAADDPSALAAAANALTEQDDAIVHMASIAKTLSACLVLCDDESLSIDLAVIKAELANYGLGPSHIHMRLNAAQLHNAVRSEMPFYGEPDVEGQRRRMLTMINDMIARATPVDINFASIAYEQTTAKRIFMLMAQMIKHVDSESPIRFLIAETESPFTMLSALYFAKLFGVDHRVDLSPLFETSLALERGSDVIAELLDSPHYLDYIRRRGRLCIQTGFSDAGRFLGQPAATLAIERLHIKLAGLLKKRNLQDIEIVIFNTHGESIGRGAHPGSMEKRVEYLFSGRARASFREAGINVKHETSFQGGDGYLFFENGEMALATLTRLLESHIPDTNKDGPVDDLLYDDSDHSLEFFLRLKSWFEHVVDNEDYAALLGMFNTRLLPVTGSRKSSRQHDGISSIAKSHPSQMRAIPNNALLQQMGYMANSLSGVGQSVKIDPDSFHIMHAGSARMQVIMEMIATARRKSSLLALAAYNSLFDAGYWLSRAYADSEPELQDEFLRLSGLVETTGVYPQTGRIIRHFQQDAIELNQVLSALDYGGRDRDDSSPTEMDMLHAVRLALIMHLWLKTMRIPRFSDRNDITVRNLQTMILALDMDHALPILREAFPYHAEREGLDRYAESSSYKENTETGYDKLHHDIFEPVAGLHRHILRIGSAISYYLGAHG